MSKEEALRRAIKAGQAKRNYTNEDVATRMHMSVDQFNRRLKFPEKISVADLLKFETVLGIKLTEW